MKKKLLVYVVMFVSSLAVGAASKQKKIINIDYELSYPATIIVPGNAPRYVDRKDVYTGFEIDPQSADLIKVVFADDLKPFAPSELEGPFSTIMKEGKSFEIDLRTYNAYPTWGDVPMGATVTIAPFPGGPFQALIVSRRLLGVLEM